MRAGDLDKTISIQKQSNVSDGMGGFTMTWVDIVTGSATATNIWAAIWPVSAKQKIEAMQEQSTITHRVRVRYRSGITAGMRIKFGSRVFDIIEPPIDPNMANKMLDILAREVA